MLVALLLVSPALGRPPAAVPPSDTTVYVVLNHGRPAGGLRIVTRGDSVIAHYHHVDRNRGPRSETRYLIRNDVVLGGATWTLPLYGPDSIPPGKPPWTLESTTVARQPLRSA